ncbi:MAG: DNA glycosylase [Clostridia bacterium]|nr:DNA glycosylase [Clostridia bacterium]
MITRIKDSIVITDEPQFDIQKVLECGQIFRYHKIDNGYVFYSLDKCATATTIGNQCVIVSDDIDYFYNYLDLDTDYERIYLTLHDTDDCMRKATEYGQGIRILRQNTLETIICFIISANNNIKRIQGIVERLCTYAGDKTAYGYAFPTLEQLSCCSVDIYRQVGCGYRSQYLFDTVQAIHNGQLDINSLHLLDTQDAKQQLLKLKGVGGKVADCILLFGMGRYDVFPTDTWIKKVYEQNYGDGNKCTDIATFFVNKYLKLSGYAQQYLFYYQRAGNF